MRLPKAIFVGALAVALAIPGVAAGAATHGIREVYVAMPGAQSSGPAADQRVHVLEVGSARARQVLVLVPGQFGAVNDFRALAEELVARLPDTQVWAVDRREQDLADLSGFRGTPDHAAAYYLGGHYRSQAPQSSSFVGQWGLGAELADLRQVVLTARDHGHRSVRRHCCHPTARTAPVART